MEENRERIFLKAVETFKQQRMKEIELDYELHEHRAGEGGELDVLYQKLLELLGDNRKLLVRYADLLVARYNINTQYFYDQGFSDFQGLLQLFRKTLSGELLIPSCFAEEDGGEEQEGNNE